MQKMEIPISSETFEKITGQNIEGASKQFGEIAAVAVAILVCTAIGLYAIPHLLEVKQRQKTKRKKLALEKHRDDVLFNLSEVKDSKKTDLNDDGKTDIQTTTTGDGTVTRVPLTSAGEDFLGTNNAKVTESGLSGEEIADYFENTQGDLPDTSGGLGIGAKEIAMIGGGIIILGGAYYLMKGKGGRVVRTVKSAPSMIRRAPSTVKRRLTR